MLGFSSIGTNSVGLSAPINLVSHPTSASPISAFELRSPYLSSVRGATINGRRKQLALPKDRIPRLKIGMSTTFPGASAAMRVHSAVLMHRIPMAISVSPRPLMLRRTYGYVMDAFIPLDLSAMSSNMEAAWLMRLYETSVNKIREESLPKPKAGALKVSTPTLKNQAYSMRERDNSYIF